MSKLLSTLACRNKAGSLGRAHTLPCLSPVYSVQINQ